MGQVVIFTRAARPVRDALPRIAAPAHARFACHEIAATHLAPDDGKAIAGINTVLAEVTELGAHVQKDRRIPAMVYAAALHEHLSAEADICPYRHIDALGGFILSQAARDALDFSIRTPAQWTRYRPAAVFIHQLRLLWALRALEADLYAARPSAPRNPLGYPAYAQTVGFVWPDAPVTQRQMRVATSVANLAMLRVRPPVPLL